jgi:hypothetical protein
MGIPLQRRCRQSHGFGAEFKVLEQICPQPTRSHAKAARIAPGGLRIASDHCSFWPLA